MTKTINEPEGRKYVRLIHPLPGTDVQVDAKTNTIAIHVDVYCVINAFHPDGCCPAVAHAVKKLLCPGNRGKGDALADLIGAEAAISRAIEEERRRLRVPTEPTKDQQTADRTAKEVNEIIEQMKLGRMYTPINQDPVRVGPPYGPPFDDTPDDRCEKTGE